MRLFLAPMEGLADALMRDMLTRVGGYDLCVTEFVRVTDTLLPERTFLRLSPELLNGGKTSSGVPVRVQLLGNDPAALSENAAKVAELGAPGVDLNFGCPAPTVNRHRGGAVLLEEPELILSIVAAVRRAVSEGIPVTAKMRLGLNDTGRALECAQAIESAGADELIVHARTKADAYRHPARWEWLARVREAVKIPMVANGDVWLPEDWGRIREASGCDDVMIGRGAVTRPDLARRIRGGEAMAWEELQQLLRDYYAGVRTRTEPRHAPGRLKLWLGMLKDAYPEAEALYQRVRGERDAEAVARLLDAM